MPSSEINGSPTQSADVAVVGGGLAGLQCAVRLAEARPQLSVLVIDPDALGGCMKWAVGSFTAAGTQWQRRSGIDDTSAAHFEDLLLLCAFDGSAEDEARYRELLRTMCDAGSDLLDELSHRGVDFSGPYPEAPHRCPRMHNAVPSALSAANALAAALAQSSKAEVVADEMVDLAREDGGFSLRTLGGAVLAQTVVVASGDRSGSNPSVPAVNPRASGRPLQLAASILGARLHTPRFTPGLRTFAPGKPLVAPVDPLVRSGHVMWGDRRVPGDEFLSDPARFAREDLYLETTAPGELASGFVCTFPGIGYARLVDLERAGLACQLARARGWRVGPMRVVVTLADGALDVDREMRVLDGRGKPIERLYACGTSALGGITLGGHGHHLLWAVATGTAVARSIANRV
jgi:fumarate reductase flavoprotein subunit